MIDKKTVARHFSRAAGTYDRYAVVQVLMADELAGYLPELPADGDILEIGAGTGMVTERLLERYPGRKLTLVDISEAMTELCSCKFSGRKTVSAVTADGELLAPEEGSQALIVSGAAFQWYRNPGEALQKYLKALVPGGFLLFSTFGPGTFRELYSAFETAYRNLGFSYSHTQGQELLPLSKWEGMLSGYRILESRSRFREVYYEEVSDFLHALQKTGANNAEQERRRTPPAAVREMIREYRRSSPEKIRVTYETLFILAVKKEN